MTPGRLVKLVALVVLAGAVTAQYVPSESKLRQQLLKSYDMHTRPGLYAGGNVTTTTTINIDPIILSVDACDRRMKATVGGWMSLEWLDPRLVWEPTEYGGVTELRIDSQQLWTPDLLPFNARPAIKIDWLRPTLALATSNGTVRFVPPFQVDVNCHFNTTKIDEKTHHLLVCPLKVGSWTRSEKLVDLKMRYEVNMNYYEPSGWWALKKATNTRVVKKYSCCPDNYVTSEVQLAMAKRYRSNVAYFTES